MFSFFIPLGQILEFLNPVGQVSEALIAIGVVVWAAVKYGAQKYTDLKFTQLEKGYELELQKRLKDYDIGVQKQIDESRADLQKEIETLKSVLDAEKQKNHLAFKTLFEHREKKVALVWELFVEVLRTSHWAAGQKDIEHTTAFAEALANAAIEFRKFEFYFPESFSKKFIASLNAAHDIVSDYLQNAANPRDKTSSLSNVRKQLADLENEFLREIRKTLLIEE